MIVAILRAISYKCLVAHTLSIKAFAEFKAKLNSEGSAQ